LRLKTYRIVKTDGKQGENLASPGGFYPPFHISKKGGKGMKKLWIVCLVLIFAASLAGLGFAQEKAKKEEPAPAAKAAPQKPPEAVKAKMEEKKEAPKPVTWRAGGVVESVDVQAKVLTIHQVTIHHDRTLKLKASGAAAKELSALKTGDLVNVWIRDQMITSLTKLM
jgi:Cu/Ag efflux protein CusF